MGRTIRILAFNSWQGLGIFLFTTKSRAALVSTWPPIQWIPGALSLGVKRLGVKLTTHLNLLPRSRVCGVIPPLPQYAFMAWFLEHRDNFTFTFTFTLLSEV
jgi:hypothetical protein